MTKIEKYKNDFFDPRNWNDQHYVMRKPFDPDLLDEETGFKLMWNKVTNEANFYHIVPDLLVDYVVLKQTRNFSTPEECWNFFENDISKLVKNENQI